MQSTNRTEDQLLIKRLLNNDQLAYRELIASHNDKMTSVARAIVGNVFVDDVVQDAWISIYRALPKFKGKSSLKTWILTIVSNEAKTRIRKESRHVSLDAMSPDTSSYLSEQRFQADGHWDKPPADWAGETAESLLQIEQLQECINKSIQNLPDMQKAVFELRDIELLNLDEVCNILDITNSNARVLLHRARLNLMGVIDKHQETGEC